MSTPKEIAKRIKAKGLNKLRFYCQVCEKSCRDENGYKCHLTTEGHQRAIMVFANNHKSMTTEFSNEFHSSFLEVLRRRGQTRQLANRLYQEVIGDRHHTHMNSTKWGSLTAYLMWLREQNIAEVEETPKGIFVQYIDHNPDTLKRQEERNRIERAEQRDAQRFERQLAQRVAALTANADDADEPPKELKAFDRTEHADAIGFAIPTKRTPDAVLALDSNKRKLGAAFGDDNDDDVDNATVATTSSTTATATAATTATESAVADAKSKKACSAEPSDHRKSHWIKTHLVVKVMNKKLADGAYYKEKGTIVKVIDKLTAEVEMHKSGDVLRINQSELETVLPSAGGAVLVVNGAHRGTRGTLESLDVANFAARIKLASGQVESLPYEDVCKTESK
jgi:DNA/RNA-binding protein KIN17